MQNKKIELEHLNTIAENSISVIPRDIRIIADYTNYFENCDIVGDDPALKLSEEAAELIAILVKSKCMNFSNVDVDKEIISEIGDVLITLHRYIESRGIKSKDILDSIIYKLNRHADRTASLK